MILVPIFAIAMFVFAIWLAANFNDLPWQR